MEIAKVAYKKHQPEGQGKLYSGLSQGFDRGKNAIDATRSPSC
jgi:hypothetical protein